MSFPWPSAEVFIFVIDQARNMTFYCVRFPGKHSSIGCSSHWAIIYRTILEKTRNFIVITLSLASYKLWRSFVRYFLFSALCVTELISIQSIFDLYINHIDSDYSKKWRVEVEVERIAKVLEHLFCSGIGDSVDENKISWIESGMSQFLL